jgi:hypothetical protein
MALEFPREWRFNESLGRMPQQAMPDLITLIEKVAGQAKSPKAVYEIFKGRFGDASLSVTTLSDGLPSRLSDGVPSSRSRAL